MGLDSCTDVPRSRRNIDNRTGMKQQVPIVATIPDSNIASNCDILDSVRRTSDLAHRILRWQSSEKGESGNLGGKKTEILSAKIISKFKIGQKSIIWNHKDYNSIHVDPNHANSNQPIPDNLTNIR